MPAKAGGARGSTEATIPHVDHSVHTSALNRYHVLTDGHGRYTALLSRRTGALTRLGEGARA